MRILRVIIIIYLCTPIQVKSSDKLNRYEGKFCSGKGDLNYLKLIDESFAFFHPTPVVPNLTMVYNPVWNTFEEGAGWGGWWIQNSYGFSYAATPFLQEPWFTILQQSWNLFWDSQGDGKRKGLWGDGIPNKISELIAPDGALGDVAAPGKIIYKQGDGDVDIHDWFYEATAAGVVMQAEILLASRDLKAIEFYLSKMERACDFIEKTRDPKNNLFLVGPACNLLAPSYGGVKQSDGSFGKGYLAGLSITYLAALDRMVELYKLTGNKEKLSEYENRRIITRESLSLLLTPDGYFVKSIEKDGTKHGVLGQEKFGYLEGVANVDAVALRVVDNKIANSIYNQIEKFPAIRPFDFVLTNAPGLDDTYWSWGNTQGKEMEGFHMFGDWVNGGAWGTVEGRAILMYYRLGKFQDIFRSATRAMKWAKDFRMDAPWSQLGENTNNPWSDTGKYKVGSVAVMIDNFAIPAATIRGLFDYDYKFDRIILRPRIPNTITQYVQKNPIRFGEKKLFLTCNNGGNKIKKVTVNGKAIKINSKNEVELFFDELPTDAKIEIITEGGWPTKKTSKNYPVIPSLNSERYCKKEVSSSLPGSLKEPFVVCTKMKEQLENIPGVNFDLAFINAILEACNTICGRKNLNCGTGYFRPLTLERKADINKFYEQAALTMYKGFENQMENYANMGNYQQKQVAELFHNVQKREVNQDSLDK
jgi:hypothetical protein